MSRLWRTDGRTHGKWKVVQYSVWAESAIISASRNRWQKEAFPMTLKCSWEFFLMNSEWKSKYIIMVTVSRCFVMKRFCRDRLRGFFVKTFCQTCLRRFVGTAWDVLSGRRFAGIGQNLSTNWAILGCFLATTLTILNNTCTWLGRSWGATWAILGQYVIWLTESDPGWPLQALAIFFLQGLE